MKASLFLAFFCLAAVAVTTASAENIKDVPEYKGVEAADNGDAVQPLVSCQAGGDWLCDKSCKLQGRNSGRCNSDDVCICSN